MFERKIVVMVLEKIIQTYGLKGEALECMHQAQQDVIRMDRLTKKEFVQNAAEAEKEGRE